MTTSDATEMSIVAGSDAAAVVASAGRFRAVRAVALIACGAVMLAIALTTVILVASGWTTGVRPLADSPVWDLTSASAFLAWSATGALVLARRPGNRVGLILVSAGLAGQLWVLLAHYAARGLVAQPGSLPAAEFAAWASGWLPILAYGLCFTFLLLMFPDGMLPSRRWRPFAWFAGGAVAFTALTWATEPGPLYGVFEGIENPAGLRFGGWLDPGDAWGLLVLAVAGSAVAPILRLRRLSGVPRRQLKWFTYTGGAVALTWVAVTVGSELGEPFTTLADLTYPLAVFALPVSVLVAIFRHNLYDIDVVISRTIVVGALAVLVTAGYLAIVSLVGTAIGRAGGRDLGLSVLATAVVAAAFQPVRTRMQRLAKRLVYGKRSTPYEVLTVLARRMGDAHATEDLLPRLANNLAQGTGAARAEVWLRTDRRLQLVAAWPNDLVPSGDVPIGSEPVVLPGASEVAMVRHQGEVVGALAITVPPGQVLSSVERGLVADLAAQVGVALDNVRLVAELKASRKRIVAAQDEERRRIERDIHDGVQQRLVSLTLALRMAAAELGSSSDNRVVAAVADAAEEARAVMAELRRLARGIHPAILSEGGLRAAIESLAERSAVPSELVCVPIPRLSTPVEVTIYYVVAEALTNVAKHAKATSAEIRVDLIEGCILVTVSDDGIGGALPGAGSGLTGLADRVHALDGRMDVDSPPGKGTRLRAEIPCASS